MIVPTVGRVVWYRPNGPENETLAAIIAGVNSDRNVNLAVFDMYGVSYAKIAVQLLQDNDETPCPHQDANEEWLTPPYCEWMPYQIGQAKKNAE